MSKEVHGGKKMVQYSASPRNEPYCNLQTDEESTSKLPKGPKTFFGLFPLN